MNNHSMMRVSAMSVLWLVTVIWAFSFSLIGVYLSGQVDSYLAVFIRVSLAFLVFAPLFRPLVSARKLALLAAIGGIQLGATYILLYHAFNYLSVAEVLLFTIFTPLWITLIDELVLQRRHLPLRWWLGSAAAVLGAAIIRYEHISADALQGFLLIQGANLCFATGQVSYKRLPLGDARQQLHSFAAFFAGAAIVSGLGVLLLTDWSMTPGGMQQWGVLLWLGLGASGGGYLGWALASKRVNTGQLATMNNMLIPAGIGVNFLFWGQQTDWPRLLAGGAIIGLSVWICRRRKSRE